MACYCNTWSFEDPRPLADNPITMARQAQIPEQDSVFDFKEIKQRFLDLNKARLRRTLGELRQRQREFVDLLPLLYHINHPTLPGYVSKTTPAGIPEYTPNNETLNLSKRISKSFAYKKRAYRRYHIQALYLMGSTGTIAYSNKSDFDIWICYDSSLKPDQIESLKKKSHAIEEWAETLDIDAHIFLVNPEEFKQGKHDALNKESSGTALHYLLLEEFYRTSLLLAGRYPIWWLVPPEYEQNYEEFVSDIKTKRFIHGRDNIDFGGLAQVPAEEFYGATLWLLYKGINSPYKSVLKTLLMEAYASEYPNIDILGLRFKQAIYNGENELNKLDPYLMMLDKVEEYLNQNQQTERLELIRRSFYFKVNEKLSEESSKESNWRRDLLNELVNAWRWTNSQIYLLDSKEDWKIQRVIEERNALMNELTHSYRFLSAFARQHSESNLIDPNELNLLGRKLYAAFERKAGKIDIIYRGITNNLNETHLSFHQLQGPEQAHFWVVFNGIVNENDAQYFPALKRAHSLIELLAWCYFNKIITPSTTIAIYANHSNLTEKELKLLSNAMASSFSDDILDSENIDDLKKPAAIKQVLTVINSGLDPFVQHTRRGEHLTSNRTDSLRYGGRLENLTNSIDQIIITSWNEVLTFRYQGVDGLFRCLHDYMQWMPPSQGIRPPAINSVSYSSYRGDAIASRSEKLFQNVLDCFYDPRNPAGTRFIMAIEWDYYVLSIQGDTLKHVNAGNIQSLRSYLSSPTNHYQHIVFDPETLNDDVLPLLFSLNRPNRVQVYFKIKDKLVDTYILDEKGSLFYQESDFYDATSLVNQYETFFDSISNRLSFSQDDSRHKQTEVEYEYNYVQKNNDGGWEVLKQRKNMFKQTQFVELQVIGNKVGDHLMFKVYLEGKEYSTMEHGEQLYRLIAEHILRIRKNSDTYPIYITDIDVSRSMIGDDSSEIQTIHYLNYKKYFEKKLQARLEKYN
jgi:adenylate cyclase class 1